MIEELMDEFCNEEFTIVVISILHNTTSMHDESDFFNEREISPESLRPLCLNLNVAMLGGYRFFIFFGIA
jgi:hypothetical protein